MRQPSFGRFHTAIARSIRHLRSTHAALRRGGRAAHCLPSHGFIAGALLVLGTTLCSVPALGSVFRALSLEELVSNADRIVIATHLGSESAWNRDRSRINTEHLFRVEEVLRGAKARELRIETPGGTVGTTTQFAHGAATFEPGGRYVVFVDRSARGTTLRVVGWSQGRFRIRTDPVSGRDTLERPLPGMTLIGDSDLTASLPSLEELRVEIERILTLPDDDDEDDDDQGEDDDDQGEDRDDGSDEGDAADASDGPGHGKRRGSSR